MNRVKVKSIVFSFTESPCGWHVNKPFASFAAAERALSEMRVHAPSGGTYHKTGFVITYEDGEIYEGRYDVGCDDPTLAEHVYNHCAFWSGQRCPGHFDPVQYAAFLAEHEDAKTEYADFINRYDLGVTCG